MVREMLHIDKREHCCVYILTTDIELTNAAYRL